jgi:hypothetical protein
MNIRVQPTVRCSYVAEENVLRIVLKEVVGGTGNVGSSAAAESSDSRVGSGDSTNQEVVVYALKVRSERSLSFLFPSAWFDWKLMMKCFFSFFPVVSLAVHVQNMISKNSPSRSSKVHISKPLQH